MSALEIEERIKEEKNWDNDIAALIKNGIPIYMVTAQLLLTEVLNKTLKIISDYIESQLDR